ncbi:MAG TPA: hypothetical protein DF712_06575 [Balneola sp.]|nr:hypothetical protein [Balneola sp.]
METETRQSNIDIISWNSQQRRLKRLFLKTAASPDKDGRRFVTWEQIQTKTGLNKEDFLKLRKQHGVWKSIMMQVSQEMYAMKVVVSEEGLFLRAR